MKVIIAGSRGFKDYDLLVKVCDKMLSNLKKSDVEIIVPTEFLSNTLSEKYAIERTYKFNRFHADHKYGKGANYVRGNEMIKYADALMAFWNGSADSIKYMINLAKKNGLKIKIQLYKPI